MSKEQIQDKTDSLLRNAFFATENEDEEDELQPLGAIMKIPPMGKISQINNII